MVTFPWAPPFLPLASSSLSMNIKFRVKITPLGPQPPERESCHEDRPSVFRWSVFSRPCLCLADVCVADAPFPVSACVQALRSVWRCCWCYNPLIGEVRLLSSGPQSHILWTFGSLIYTYMYIFLKSRANFPSLLLFSTLIPWIASCPHPMAMVQSRLPPGLVGTYEILLISYVFEKVCFIGHALRLPWGIAFRHQADCFPSFFCHFLLSFMSTFCTHHISFLCPQGQSGHFSL